MLITLALVVLCSSILLFFSREFAQLLKKFFAIPGMAVFAPLFLASILVILYEPRIWWGLLFFKYYLHVIINYFAHRLPFKQFSFMVAKIIFLFAAAVLPTFAFVEWRKRKIRVPFSYTWLIFLILWLFFVVLLTVNFNYTAEMAP